MVLLATSKKCLVIIILLPITKQNIMLCLISNYFPLRNMFIAMTQYPIKYYVTTWNDTPEQHLDNCIYSKGSVLMIQYQFFLILFSGKLEKMSYLHLCLVRKVAMTSERTQGTVDAHSLWRTNDYCHGGWNNVIRLF